MQLVITLHEKDFESIKKGYLPFGAIADAIINGTPLSKNPTNGDVIKAMFPNVRIIEMPEVEVVEVHDGLLGESRNFSWEWWNSPYKESDNNDT